MYVWNSCGCEFDVDAYDGGCCGSSYIEVDDVEILKMCDVHLKELNEKFGN